MKVQEGGTKALGYVYQVGSYYCINYYYYFVYAELSS